MPHVIVGAHDETLRSTEYAILLNGITTHGHPRALLGALAYGFALWQAVRVSGTLLKTEDGQILYVRKLERKTKDASLIEVPIEDKGIPKLTSREKRRVFKVIKAVKIVSLPSISHSDSCRVRGKLEATGVIATQAFHKEGRGVASGGVHNSATGKVKARRPRR